MRDFNLLVTTMRGIENAACSELRHLLQEIGDSEPLFSRTGVSGLIAGKSALNPFDVVDRLRALLREHPYKFRYALRVIPVEKVVRTDMGEIRQTILELAPKIGEHETFRVTVEKRFTTMHSKDVIEAIAASVKRDVCLTKPDKILLVEIVGGLTGISLIQSDDVLSIQKEKLL